LIEASRAALDGPVLLVSNVRDVTVRGLRVEAGAKDNNRQLPPLAEFRAAKLLVTNCAFTGPGQDGIHIGDNSEVELAECLVAGLWSEGIVISGARGADPRVVVRDSEIRNIYHYGILIGRACDRVQILRCRISGTAWHGIRYDSASPFIEGNTIYNHARCGIYASGRTRATVRGNLFYGNEMDGMSCWFDNQDLIENNTFAANEREGLAVLGASKPKVRANIFWANPTAISEGSIGNDESKAKGAAVTERNLFWKNEKIRTEDDVAGVKKDAAWFSLEFNPGFSDPEKLNFALTAGSSARSENIGVLQPLTMTSPWPILDEEKQLIPDGPSRDSNAWKKSDGSVQAPANRYQRQQQLYRSVESIVKDALQIDDVEKRAAAVEKIRAKISDKNDEEAAAGLVAYQSIGTVKFDKKSFHDALITKLDSNDPFVRTQAIQSLSGGAGDRADLERLMKLSTDPDSLVRSAVGWSLVWLTNKDLTGPEGTKWVEIFEAGNAPFRKELVHGLWGVKTTVPLQERLASLSREQGELAYDCLYYALSTSPNKGEACVTRLIEYLADADTTNVAGRAAWGLTYGVEPDQKDRVADAMLKVCEARDDGYMRKNAFNCLAEYARAKHVATLEGFLAKQGLSDDDRKKIEGIVASAKQRN
jgi:parallel beta-helix repeat protein